MATLREKLERLAQSEMNRVHLFLGAQLALEAVRADMFRSDPQGRPWCDERTVNRLLASLASEGKGG